MTQLVAAYEQLLLSSEIQLMPITLDILKQAAQLRAITNLKTPDAIHAATALASGCVQLITNDDDLRRVHGLSIVVLREVAAS
jgi:predicted nucleic acid-binding protein